MSDDSEFRIACSYNTKLMFDNIQNELKQKQSERSPELREKITHDKALVFLLNFYNENKEIIISQKGDSN